jgi:hypothetical protein
MIRVAEVMDSIAKLSLMINAGQYSRAAIKVLETAIANAKRLTPLILLRK